MMIKESQHNEHITFSPSVFKIQSIILPLREASTEIDTSFLHNPSLCLYLLCYIRSSSLLHYHYHSTTKVWLTLQHLTLTPLHVIWVIGLALGFCPLTPQALFCVFGFVTCNVLIYYTFLSVWFPWHSHISLHCGIYCCKFYVYILADEEALDPPIPLQLIMLGDLFPCDSLVPFYPPPPSLPPLLLCCCCWWCGRLFRS